MPSISLRFRPASIIASSAALLMRSSEEEPSCLPNAVSPTPVMKLMTVKAFDPAPCSSFRDGPKDQTSDVQLHIGESRDSGFAASRRPGMTAQYFRPSCSQTPISIRLRQAQNLLGNKTENELRADRGDPRDQGFAQVSLDMIFLGVAEAAMGHYRLLAGLKARFSGKIFRSIRRRAAWQPLVVLPARRQHHQPCGFELHPVLRQRMLDRLVLADRTVEHDAALGIV